MAHRKGEKEEQVDGVDLSPSKLVKAVTKNPFVKEFGEFINRGNVMELVIGVAVGGAFTTIVKSLVDDIIMPIASLIAGGVDFTKLAIDIPNIFGADTTAHIAYGNFLQNVVNFMALSFKGIGFVKLNADAEAKEEAEKQKAEGATKSD